MRFALVLLVCLLLHAAMVTSASWNSSACSDEPDYVGAGRYIFETGNWKFTSAIFHPPLSYYLNSLPLFALPLPDALWHPTPHPGGWIWYDWDVGAPLLRSFGSPMLMLRLLRLPILLCSLFLLSLLIVWSYRLWGLSASLTTGIVYSISPTILVHAGLATTDLVFALFMTGHAFTLWCLRKRPSWRLVIAAGLTAGGCLGAKANGLIVLPLGIAVIAWSLGPARGFRRVISDSATYLIAAFVVVWALYGFSVGPAMEVGGRGEVVAGALAKVPDRVRPAVERVLKTHVPAPAYWRLIGTISAYNRRGIPAYLNGEIRQTGWWYYFPVALWFKTPLPVLVLSALGAWVLFAERRGTAVTPILAAQAGLILIPAMLSSINIGVRHVISLEPLLAMAAGAFLAKATAFRASLTVGLLAWLGFGVWAVQPYPISYFNELAGNREQAERRLSDSNVDFSLDFHRLGRWQKEQGFDTIALVWLEAYDPVDYGVRYERYSDTSVGWVAIQLMKRQFALTEKPNPLARIEAGTQSGRVGSSILLYRVENP